MSSPSPGTSTVKPLGVQEGRHVGDAHLLDVLARPAGTRRSPARPGVSSLEHARRPSASPGPFSMAIVTVPIVPWPHIGRQPEVSMNRIATSQSVAGRRIEDRARHHVVAARLEHQPGADPVVVGEEMLRAAPSSSRPSACGPPPATTRTGLPQVWPSMQKKVWLAMTSQNRCGREGLRSSVGARSGDQVGDKPRGGGGLRQAEMAVAEGIDDIGGLRRAADHRQAVGQRRTKAHPLRAAFGLETGHERLPPSSAWHRRAAKVRWALRDRPVRPRRRPGSRSTAA